MERENRYMVIKRSDIDRYLGSDDQIRLRRIARDIEIARGFDGREPMMECVIVEKDWPMFEDTWKAIEIWVEGKE